MTELERLKEEKKRIELKIKELSGIPTYKRCKIDFEEYPTGKPTRHYVAIKYYPLGGRPKYQTIYSATDKEKVVEQIPVIIKELQGLYDLYHEREKEQENEK